MVDDELELLITVVVGADNESQARGACHGLLRRGGGRIVESGDCSDEEPGCWSVTISQASSERATVSDSAALSRAVRGFMRELGPDFATHRVSCEPPTAWTVLDDPDLVSRLVPKGERLLVEAWIGGNPLLAEPAAPVFADRDPDEHPEPDWEPTLPPGPAQRLRLLVKVAASRQAGAEWQARAVAGRISRDGVVTGFADHGGYAFGVEFDLGVLGGSGAKVLMEAVAAVGRTGWSPVQWAGEVATIRWAADPQPHAGILALELSASPDGPEPEPAQPEQH